MPASLPVSLSARAFIDGFDKPAYVVLSAELDGCLPDTVFLAAARELVTRHPLLRARLHRHPWLTFVPDAPSVWEAAGGAVLGDVSVPDELGTFLDVERFHPFRVWLAHGGTHVVMRLHHAIADVHAAGLLLEELAVLCQGERLPPPTPAPTLPLLERTASAQRWAAAQRAQGPTPAVSLVTRWTPQQPLAELAVSVTERRVPRVNHERLRRVASARGHGFSSLLFGSLLVAMHRYNRSRVALVELPRRLGLVTTRRRRLQGRARLAPSGFDADTQVVEAPTGLLAGGDLRALAGSVAAQLREGRARHDDLGLATLLLRRRIERVERRLTGRLDRAFTVPGPVAALRVVASDLTDDAPRSAPLAFGPVQSTHLRMLASPVAAAHVGLFTHLDHDALSFTLVSHHGALDADRLLDDLFTTLELEPRPLPRLRSVPPRRAVTSERSAPRR